MNDIPARKREAFFNNLVLLGLNKIAFEKKHGIAFHKDMFVLPNKKGYEVVTHFLFSKLSTATGKDYNVPWPLLAKEHDRMFQKTCYTHLMNFSQENVVKFPRIVPSLLSTFGSDRFYDVYLAFSCYVVYKTIKKNGNINLLSRPTTSRNNSVAAKNILQLSNMLHMQKFHETLNCTYNSHLLWKTFSENLSKYLKTLKLSLRRDDELVRQNRRICSSLYASVSGENLSLSQMIERSFECWKTVIKQWKNMKTFFSTEKKHWEILASEVDGKLENEFLNGQDYIFDTDNLPEDFCRKIEMLGFSSLEDRKLSVHRFLRLLMAYLMYIGELLRTSNIDSFHNLSIIENASSIQEDLISVQNFNKKISDEVIPEVEVNIKKLKLLNCFDDFKRQLEASSIDLCAPLPILSSNPDAIKVRRPNFDPSFEIPASEAKLLNQECHDSVFVPEKFSSSDLRFESLNDVTTSDASHLGGTDVLVNKRSDVNSSTSNEDNSHMNLNSGGCNVPSSDIQSLTSMLDSVPLDNTEFSSSTHFKMRKSWLDEESLNAMTLPDMSFDE